MPTVNFTRSNTPPDSIARASQVPNNGAPGAVTIGVGARTGANPAAIAKASMVGNNGAPAGVPRASQAPNNAAPAAVTIGVGARTGGEPVGVAFASMALNNGAPGGVPRASQAPDNAAPGAVAFESQAPDNAAPGARAIGSTSGTHDTPQQVGYAPTLGTPTDDTMHTPALIFVGNLLLNQVFGFYKAPAACAVKGVQLAVQKAPVGADVIVELVDAAGVSLARTATLPAGEAWKEITFVTPLPLLNAAIVRARCTQIGAGNTPGAYLTCNLIVQLT